MKHIGTQLKRTMQKSKETERGELLLYFKQRINIDRIRDGYPPVTVGRLGKALQGIPTKDLYYLKKVCDDSKNFSKKFWWEINPKKHEESASSAASSKFRK